MRYVPGFLAVGTALLLLAGVCSSAGVPADDTPDTDSGDSASADTDAVPSTPVDDAAGSSVSVSTDVPASVRPPVPSYSTARPALRQPDAPVDPASPSETVPSVQEPAPETTTTLNTPPPPTTTVPPPPTTTTPPPPPTTTTTPPPPTITTTPPPPPTTTQPPPPTTTSARSVTKVAAVCTDPDDDPDIWVATYEVHYDNGDIDIEHPDPMVGAGRWRYIHVAQDGVRYYAEFISPSKFCISSGLKHGDWTPCANYIHNVLIQLLDEGHSGGAAYWKLLDKLGGLGPAASQALMAEMLTYDPAQRPAALIEALNSEHITLLC